MMTVYVTTMYRYGDHEKHSYVLGVWTDRETAQRAGGTEELWRADKYKAEVTAWMIDGNEFDNVEDDGALST